MSKEPKTRRPDPYQDRARELAATAGLDPDARVERPGARSMPVWCTFLDAARDAHTASVKEDARPDVEIAPQSAEFTNSPLKIFGLHEPKTIEQMRNCMSVGNCVAG